MNEWPISSRSIRYGCAPERAKIYIVRHPFRHVFLECLAVCGKWFGPNRNAAWRDNSTVSRRLNAGCAWVAARFPAAASVQLRDDGTVRVASGTQDIGTGTYTILAQLAAQKTGVPVDKVEVVLGDTSLPEGPLSGGSMVTGSLVPAVFEAADKAIESLLTSATMTAGSPFEKRKPAELGFEGGRVFAKADGPTGGVAFADVLRAATSGSSRQR